MFGGKAVTAIGEKEEPLRRFLQFLRDDEGATAVEYAVMLSLSAEPVTVDNRAVEDVAPTPGPTGPAPTTPETAQSPS